MNINYVLQSTLKFLSLNKHLFILLQFLFFYNGVLQAQWVKTNFPKGLDVYAMVVSGNNIFAGTDGGIYISSDNGTTWNAVNNGIIGRRVVVLAASGENIYAGTSEISTDGPVGLLFLSTNSGTNWNVLFGLNTFSVSAIAADDKYVFVAGASQRISGAYYGIFASIDTGASWYETDSGLTDRDVNSLSINRNNIFAGTRSGVFLSTNYAANWEKVNYGMTDSVITSLYANGNNIYAGTYNGLFLLSTNDGQIWKTLCGSLTYIKSILVINNGNDIIVGTLGKGVFLLTSEDTNWKAINDGLTSTYSPYVYSSVVKDDDIYIGTADGVWKRPLSELTGVPNELNVLPKEYALYQNYPNPFNPTTNIQYSLATKQFVTLKVYNILGKEITTLVNEEKPEGQYSLNFNASNIPSGVYFYTIRAGSFIETKKMLLLK